MYKGITFAVAVVAVAVSGCSTTTTVKTNPSSSASASPSSSSSAASSSSSSSQSDAPAPSKLDSSSCVEITQANVDLATASSADAARKAGDAFEKYDLPSDVKDAVEHFVSTKGAQFDDPNYDKYNNAIEAWIKQVCPL